MKKCRKCLVLENVDAIVAMLESGKITQVLK